VETLIVVYCFLNQDSIDFCCKGT